MLAGGKGFQELELFGKKKLPWIQTFSSALIGEERDRLDISLA
jgi:hypothetical protein